MSKNEIVVRGDYKLDFTEDQKKVIKKQFFPPSATPEDMVYCIEVAKSVGLNPILKEIYFVERREKDPATDRWVTRIEPMPGRNAWIKLAHNSGRFAGIESEAHIENAPFLENGRWVEKPDLVATATVWRSDFDKPFVSRVSFHEYAQKKRDGKLTQFWATKPETMLKKVAEVQALRKAFSINGLYDESEVDGEVSIPPQAQKKPDLNAALTSTTREKRQKVAENVAPMVQPNAHEVVKQAQAEAEVSIEQEAPAKPRRMPLKVSKHYPKLIDAGIKQRDLKEFAVKVGLPEMDEKYINEWFNRENIEAWAAWFYGNCEHPHDLNGNITPAEEAVEAEIEEPMTVAEQEAEEVFAPKPQPQPEPVPTAQQTPAGATQLQRAAAGDGVSASVAKHYGLFIGMGLPEEDCKAFVEWAGLKADNIDEFIADPGGVADLIETFKMEAGYA